VTTLNSKDKANYQKLKDAFGQIDPTSEEATLLPAKRKIDIANLPTNNEGLRDKLYRLERYLEVSNDIDKPIRFKGSNFEQQFFDALAELKDSIEANEDEKVDLTKGTDEFQPDVLFFGFIDASQQDSTKRLIDDVDPLLDESAIGTLTNAWQTAVEQFVEDARTRNKNPDGSDDKKDKVKPIEPETFAHFFRIQKELEVLYSRLADSEKVRES
jgi:hypothetical protein